MNDVQILVLDFGSQYTQLIARRLREYGIYTEIVPYFEKIESIKAKNPKGIILSGGPASVYEKDAYKPDSAVFSLKIPILGICYGMQLLAQYFGGRVVRADAQEFGKAVLEIMESSQDSKASCPALQDIFQGTQAQTFSFTFFSHSKFPQMLGALLDLWEDSVRASHTFLNKGHIAEIRLETKAALQSAQNIIVATDKKDFLGFIGVKKNKIEMLFVASKVFRKGVGRALLKEALERYLKDYPYILVDCNEQNTQGLAFYQYLGFESIGKSVRDSAGRNFPIVHLKIDKERLQDSLKPLHYTISSAKEVDLEEILALQKIAFADEADQISTMELPALKQNLKSIKKEFKTYTFLKCTFKGKIIGSVCGYTKQNRTYISKLFVDFSYRHKGIATALMKTICATLPAKQYEIFTSERSFENIALYEKLGFVEYKREKPKGFPIQAVFLQKQQPICEGERISLRPYTKADFVALHRILSDKKTMIAWEHSFCKKESQEWLTKQLAHYQQYGFGIWAIVERQSGKIIGNAGLNHTEINLSGKTQKIVEISYLLHRDFWNKGYGSEVARMCVKYGFETLGLEEVYCLIKNDNLSSIKVAQKLTMQKAGEYPKSYKGKKINHVVFKLDKNMWRGLENNADAKNFQSHALFKGVKQNSIVWMSHADKVQTLPQGFVELAKSGNTHYCAIADFSRQIYALQFHPEVVHSECGAQILQNFAVNICKSDTSWNMRNFAQNEIMKLRKKVLGIENSVENAIESDRKNTERIKGGIEGKEELQNGLVLQGERILLRQYTQADLPALCEILGDEEVMRVWGHSFSQKEVQEWLALQQEHYKKGFGIYAIVEKQSGEIIGHTGLNYETIILDSHSKAQEVLELGYLLKKSYWHKGYASEAAGVYLHYAFALDVWEAYALISEGHEDSIQVAQKLGMRFVGVNIAQKNKKELVYRVSAKEWQEESIKNLQESQNIHFFDFNQACKDYGQTQTMQSLLSVFEEGARATHADLSEKEIAGMRGEIEDSIIKIQKLLIARREGEFLGFIAVENNEIAMLFVAPKYFQQGIGRALIKEAFMRYLGAFEVIKVASLEWALDFYLHLGFTKTGEKPIPAGNNGTFSPKLLPLSIVRERLQKSLGLEEQGGECERVRCAWANDKDEAARKLYEDYHDNEWGVPLHEDKKLFEMLVLETMQAGLSWISILKKREAFRAVFDDFDCHKIAAYSESKIESFMQNEGIIRNRAKIEAAISNARAFLEIQKEFGSFDSYIWGFVGGEPIVNHFNSIDELPAKTPLSDKIAKDLLKRGFKFVGSTSVYAFMQSVGIVNDHLTSCFKRNSSLGMQCDKILDFSQGTDAKSANLAKNPKNLHSHTTNTGIVECQDLQSLDTRSVNLAKNLHSHTTCSSEATNPHLQNTGIVECQNSNVDIKSSYNQGRQDFGDKNGALQEKSREIQVQSSLEVSLRDFKSCEDATRGSYLEGNDQSGAANSLKITKETPSKVLCAVSGGVDSSVVAALLHRAIEENLIPVFVDTGLLRKGERQAVEKMFRENLKVPLITADASELFLSRLKGVLDPEKKRKIIGETFIEVFEKEAKKYNTNGEIKFLAQGTLYPDVIESVSVKGPSKTIKSHHNVGGLPEWMKFELIEPLRELFKDEVRALGRELGMPQSMLMRHPFPGPGLAIRIMGEVNRVDLDLLREADSIFIDELRKQGYYDKVWQAFCVLLNVRSVGVMGDNRTYDNTICVRAVEAIDGMTATFAHLPHSFLESVSNRIINEVEGINRVVYDITSKPPGTIEWE